ncbi:MAG: alpha/beta family hydrolase [Dehalococcoidia bacterium]
MPTRDVEILFDGPEGGEVIVLAPGAGAGMRHVFMASMAARLAEGGLRVARFEFAYMQRAAEASARIGRPDAPAVLRVRWLEVIARLGGGRRLVIGGKSMGGRIASMVADEVEARGLVCLGYPFHAAGRPERTRTAHLEALRTPTLIVQGTRDALGSRPDVEGYTLPPSIRLHWLEDGDHSFVPRKASGYTSAEHLDAAAATVIDFVRGLP